MARDDWIKTLLIGGLLTFFGFLIIPLFAVYGYLVRALRGSIEGEATPPAFTEWGSLIVDGFQAWLIGIIYLLIPGIVALITIGGSLAAVATGTRLGTGAGVAGFIGGLAVTVVLSLVFGYLAVAAIICFAYENRFAAAFDVNRLREVVFTSEYGVAWVVSLGIFIVAGIVTSIPLIGFVVGPFVSFYAMIVAARLWAGGYIEAFELNGPSASSELG